MVIHLCLAWLSGAFAHGQEAASRSIPTVVGLEILAGAIFLLLIRAVRRSEERRRPARTGLRLGPLLLVGLALRSTMFFSAPIQEDDYYRYLWDGAVAAHGVNPYRYAPSQVQSGTVEPPPVAERLATLALDSGPVIARVNHPHLRTIYPPVAQVAFALSHLIRPWSLLAWRLVLLVSDLVAFALLLGILRALALSQAWSVIYWWNPLVLKEIYNSAHVDILVVPLALAAVLLTARGRSLSAAVFLALAAGVKLWPVLLLPLILRPPAGTRRRLVASALLFTFLLALIFLPVISAGLGDRSGFRAYAERWEMNDALFMVFLWGSRFALDRLGFDPALRHLVARTFVLGLLLVWTAWCVRAKPRTGIGYFESTLLIVAALFLLSPTQFPWYFVWVLPFLALRPRWSLLLCSVVLPVYYLRFHFSALDRVEVFDNGIVWLEFAPVWALLLWEWHRSRTGRSVWLSGNVSP